MNQRFTIPLFFFAILFSFTATTALAEGTKQTTATSSDYTHLLLNLSEYNDFGRYNGTVDQRLFIHIADPENEVVYFGFSEFYNQPHWPNTGDDINGYFRIKDPNGNVVWPTPGDPEGQQNNAAISGWAEAVAGPNQIVGSGGYNAFEFNPDGLPAGDYYIEFSRNSDSYSSGDIIVPYYDITVATESTTPTAIDGRVFSYNWAFMCPAIDYPNDFFDRDFTGKMFIYSDDGFVSSIDFAQAEFRGAAFNLAFNSSGTSATGDFEVDRASVEDANVTFAEYRIFLNRPDDTAFPDGTFGEFVTNADFPKLYGCPDDNEWFFRFAATEPGIVEILIDADGNLEFDPGTADLLFTTTVTPFPGESPPYLRDIAWDGLDGLGNPIPTNTTLNVEYSYSQGFYHFPVYDVERLETGMDVESVTVTPQPYQPEFYYDDRAISESLPDGQPDLELNGCTPPCHYWSDIEYGDLNTINTYWFAYRSETVVTIPFETPPPTCAGCPFTPYEILGSVYHDANGNGIQDGSEEGVPNITINVYDDANGNGVYNAGTDPLITTVTTDANGDYSAIGQEVTEHLIVIDQSSLPQNSDLTTDGLLTADFFSLFDATCDNDFGFRAYPIANTDFDTIQDQTIPLVVDVQENDIDPFGDGVTTTIVTPPLNGGTATVLNGDSIEYTAIPDFIGVDSLEYAICDDEGLCDTAWVIIQIGDICNDGIDNDGDGLIDNYSPQIVVTASGVDPYCEGFSDGTLTGSATGGRAPYDFLWVNNSAPYATAADVEDVPDGTYILSVTDANGCKEEETVVLTAGNCPPIANPDYNNTFVNTPVSGNVLTNDFDLNGDDIAVSTPSPLTPPTNGTVVLNPNGTYTYTPDPGFVGNDEFTYIMCDDGVPSECDTASVFIDVIQLSSENDPPVANSDDAVTSEDVPVSGNVLSNDFDPDGDDIILNLNPLSGPDNGSVVLQNDGSYTYTPNPGFIGTDVFTYEICDDVLPSLCDTTVVTINVIPDPDPGNDPPFAADDAANTTVDVPVSGDLLVNDFDPNGDNITVNTTPVTGTSNGSVTINPDGTFDYTPDPGYSGPDQFVYQICDDGVPSLCATATTYITVNPRTIVATADSACIDDVPYINYSVDPQDFATTGPVTIEFFDPQGNLVETYTNQPLSGQVLWPGAEVDGNGVGIDWPGWVYANGAWTQGADGFEGLLPNATVVFSVNPTDTVIVGYPPATPFCAPRPPGAPVAVNDFNNTLVNVPVSGNVLTNDYDPEGNNLTANGTLVTDPSNGSVTLNPDGSYTYTPNTNYAGEDFFVYVMCNDAPSSLCDTAVVFIEVIPISDDNDPPVANPDPFITLEGVPVSGDILTNDDDPDGDNLVPNTTPIDGPSNGTVTINPDGSFTYTPDPGFTGQDIFTYEVCDDGTPVLCDTSNVVIDVIPDPNGPDNDPPFAGDDAALTPVNVPVSGDLLVNDFDPNGDNIIPDTTPISDPSNGSVVINPDGTYTYTPDPGYLGPDQFVYEICDDGTPSLCAQATAYITVYAGPSIDFVITEPDCNGEATGSIDITVNNAVEPLTYSWSNGATTEDLTNVAAGTYVVTVTDALGSTVQQTIQLTEPEPVAVVVSVQDETIVNGCNGEATANPSGGTEPYTYQWSDGQTTQTATGLCAGIYEVTVTDANGCEVTTSNVINPPSCDLDVLVNGQSVDCNGGADGSVTANPITQQNNTPFTYLWNTGATTQTISGVSAGPYSVTVTDSIGCTASGSFVVTEPTELALSANAADEQTFNGCDGSATASGSGGTQPYLYEWSDGQIGETASGLCPGTYTVTITDANGCSTQTTVTVNAISCAGFDVDINTYRLSCFEAGDGAAVAVVSGGTGPYTYFWTSGGATTDSIGGLAAGTVEVTVTDDVGCEQTVTAAVTQPALLQATTAVDPVTCHGLDNGAIELTVTGGTTPYSFAWSNGATTEDLNSLAPGTYGVTVTDANGCEGSASGAVTQPDTLEASSINTDVTCFGGSDGAIDLTPDGGLAPYTYSWAHGPTTQDVSGLSAGDYTVTFVDQNACVFEYTTTIGESNQFEPTITADGPTVFCDGDSVELSATSGSDYLWSTGATTQSITVFASGNYSVTVTTDEGCTGTSDAVSVTVNPNPNPTVSAIGSPVVCDGETVTLTTNSFAGGYLWSTGETTQSITVDTSGAYTVVVENANGCEGTSAPFNVTVNELPEPTITADGSTSFCEGSDVTLTASGAVSYVWSNGQNTPSITVSTEGGFTVTGTDANGCEATSDTLFTTVFPEPEPEITADGPTTICDGDSVVLTASSGFANYAWSTGETTESITVSTPGTYTVTVTDANDCVAASDPVTITVNPTPTPNITADGPLEFCDGDSVILTASNATSYLWSTGETTQSIAVLTDGDYTVTTTLNTGCSGVSDTASVTVFDNPLAEITANGPTEICAGGSVQLTATSGNAYLWSTGSTAQTINVNGSGSFWVTVTNVNGCSTMSDTVDVTVNPNPTPVITADGPLEFCDGDSVVLTASSADTYLWSNGSTTQSITVFESGTFSVEVADANGCDGTSAPVTVVVNDLPFSFIFATGPTEFCEGDSVDLVARESDGYLWTTGDTTRIITVSTSGTYSVTNIDDNGCQQQSNEITVTVNPTPNPNISVGGPLAFCDGEEVTLTVNIPGNPNPEPPSISYTWNTGETTQSISAEDEGSYYATIVDANGCVGNTDTVDVEVWSLPEPEVTTIGTPSFCAGDTIFLTTTEEFESYLWTNTGDTTQNTFAVETGFYTVTVTDTNGCEATSPENLITVNVTPTPTTTPDGTVEICDGDTITITSVEAESYLWSTGDTTQAIQVSQAGTYNVSATDQNGCVGVSSDVIVIVNQPPSPTIVANGDVDFCLGGSVTLSTTEEYETYQWNTGANAQSILVNQSGTYTVTVTDSVGCATTSAFQDVTVYQPPTVTVDVDGPTQFCFGDSVVLTASPGQSYSWSNEATTQSITVFTSGSFEVDVTDENGCVGTSDLVTIEVYNQPNVDIIADGPTTFCQGESVTLTAQGGFNYQWSNGAQGSSITVTDPGSYYVVGGNSFGCVDTSASVAVTVNAPPTVTVFPDGPTTFCDGGSVGLVASGADTYLWSTGETGTNIVVSSTGVYSVTGTNANGCTATTSGISVTVNPDPEPTIDADGPLEFCVGDSVVLTSSSADSYLWSTGATTQSITVLNAGTYSVTVVDANGCEGTSDAVDVITNDIPVPTISLSGPAEFCIGDSVVLTVQAGDAYLWNTGETTQSIVVDSAGVYSVQLTDNNGCTGSSADVEITVFDDPVPEIAVDGDTVLCQGETVTLTAAGGTDYAWSTGANVSEITVGQIDTYTVTVTDANGCSAMDSVAVEVNPLPTPPPVITPDGPTEFCAGDSVTLEVDDWNTYLWSNGDTTQSTVATTTGLYVVTVTNEFGCEADAAGVSVTVNENPQPQVQTSGDGEICAGEVIELTTGVFNSYEWTTGDTTQSILVDTTGIYAVTVTNADGCVGTSEGVEVTSAPLPEVTVEAQGPTTVCEGDEVTLTAVGDGPYLWNNNETTQTITVSQPGDYFVQATDTVTGCVGVSDDVTVENYPDFEPEILVDGPTSFCSNDSVVLSVSEGTSFVWSTADTTQSITVSETGVYEVTVTDENGCVGTDLQPITVIPTPVVEIIPDADFPYCAGDEVTLTATGVPFVDDFVWNTGETTQTITVTESDVYTVTVTNPLGCSETASLPIGFLPTPNAQVEASATSICEGDEAELTAIGLPFVNEYVWSDGQTGQQVSVTEAGTYSVTVTSNATGCSATSDEVTVDVVPGPTADAGMDMTICVGDSAVLTASGGDNIVWQPGGSGSSITVSPMQDEFYIVEVTNDGCDQVASDTVFVNTEAYPTAGFGFDHTNLGDPIQFTDSSMTPPLFSWDWDFGDGNFSEAQNPIHEYDESGEYAVTLVVATEAGCADTVTQVLNVEEFFSITNVLTPNGDGTNDYVWITSSLAELIEAKIYNRWGASVWEGIGQDLRFTGMTNAGVDLPAGTYYYAIRLDYGDAGVEERTGYITLIRNE